LVLTGVSGRCRAAMMKAIDAGLERENQFSILGRHSGRHTMARKVFFSFHYDRDNWRVSQVRNSWVTKPDHEASRFLDKAEWQAIERQGRQAIQNWIDSQLKGTSVTVVLIGQETAGREWVGYEVKKSHEDGKGMLGVFIHNLKNKDGHTDTRGQNPFDRYYFDQGGSRKYLSSIYNSYDWANDNGYKNLPNWVESAARVASR
jgi:antiphage defense system Thoeris ThsB-like protein